jgi:hypothetical protein
MFRGWGPGDQLGFFGQRLARRRQKKLFFRKEALAFRLPSRIITRVRSTPAADDVGGRKLK